METIVMSVGGSLVCPKNSEQVVRCDEKYVEELIKFIHNHHKFRFILVVGGGERARAAQNSAREKGINDIEKLDWLGIEATWSNAEFVRKAFGEDAYEEVLKTPEIIPNTHRRIIIAGGWKPGWSTDYDAVMLAKGAGARTVINMSNIECIYDSDPAKNKKAKQLLNLSWSEYRSLIPTKWTPGANTPFDPIASRLASEEKMRVIVCNGKNFLNLSSILKEESYQGTTIE